MKGGVYRMLTSKCAAITSYMTVTANKKPRRACFRSAGLCSLYEEIIINSLTSLLRSKPADASKPGIPEELPYRCR